MKFSALCLALAATLSAPLPASAEPLRVAVASNFSQTLVPLAALFEQQSGHTVIAISGSSGKHSAQIIHGAPFDVFMSADSERPARLEALGLAVAGSRRNYARGRLALWGRDDGPLVNENTLRHGNFKFLALANPDLAPYGAASQEAIKNLGLEGQLAGRLVRGENIAQAFHFVNSGSAQLGFVARSQVLARPGRYWPIPQRLHAPIDQQLVVIRRSDAASAFLRFLKTPAALQIIRQAGYDSP